MIHALFCMYVLLQSCFFIHRGQIRGSWILGQVAMLWKHQVSFSPDYRESLTQPCTLAICANSVPSLGTLLVGRKLRVAGGLISHQEHLLPLDWRTPSCPAMKYTPTARKKMLMISAKTKPDTVDAFSSMQFWHTEEREGQAYFRVWKLPFWIFSSCHQQ